MTKRSNTLETVLLALELLRRIPRNRKVSATELHTQLVSAGMDRDLRTIQRQLEMLSAHFDIDRDDRSKPYGYRWKENSKGLALPMLGEHESLLLMLAEQHLKNLLPASLMKSMEGFFVQAHANLEQQGKAQRAREWLSKVRVVSTTQPLLPPTIKTGVFELVSNALFNNLWLNVDYKNAADKRTSSEVMPLGLAQQGPCLYLVCRFHGYDNERSLALHRIEQITTSTLSFKRPKDFDLQRFDAEGRFGFGNGKRIRLTFCIDRDAGLHLTESPLSTDQRVELVGDQLKISATVVETEQLQWWLRGFGDQVSQVRRVAIRPTKKNEPRGGGAKN